MELKTNYQYTYFIYPFIVKQNKYKEYITKMLKDKKCKLKTFEKERDLKLYKFFLPKWRDILFSSFRFGNMKLKQLEELPIEIRAGILDKYPCNIFEYDIKQDIQAKVDDKDGIYFSIRKVNVICFNTGICFLCIKTNLEDNNSFSDVLNFNYKFRDIYSETSDLENYDQIRLQTDSFSGVESFREFIRRITGSNSEMKKLNIDNERLLTYSYLCIDQEAWNNLNEFEKIEYQFNKYANNLSADNSVNFDKDNVRTFSKWKYAKIGLTKSSVSLFASNYDINHYTVLPYEYENQYLYTYIINLYKKIYLKLISEEFKNTNDIKKIRRKFSKFTKEIWVRDVTQNETGSLLNKELQEELELDDLYKEIKNKYDILYKEFNMKKVIKANGFVLIILAISLILNIYNFIILNNK